jgi:predicted DNA-binding transcriptional regulator YafY
MNAGSRRIEIISMLTARRHTTAHELAREFGVSVRTIQYDVQALSRAYPIYTKQGEHGGIFIRDDFKPYVNSLSELELKTLCDLLK